MKRFEPLFGPQGTGTGNGNGNDTSADSTAEDQLSTANAIQESGSIIRKEKEKEKERIINLIENTRLRRGDLRGEERS